MSIWTRIADALAALASGEGLTEILDRLRAPPERTVAFAIAVIGLGAKIAKADGHVTRNEVAAFREVFQIPESEEANAARVYNLARQDVAGFEEYARKIKTMFGDEKGVLCDLIEGLLFIAMADGEYHDGEDSFLMQVAEIFGFSAAEFKKIRARHVPGAEPDPYDVLGVASDAPHDEIRAAWRHLVRETHPDRMLARGVPEEAVRLAERQLVAINRAWDEISREKV